MDRETHIKALLALNKHFSEDFLSEWMHCIKNDKITRIAPRLDSTPYNIPDEELHKLVEYSNKFHHGIHKL